MEAESSQSLQKRLPVAWLQCCLVPNPHGVIRNFIIYDRKKTTLGTTLKMLSIESAVCASHDYPNPIFIVGVLPELLLDQFLWVMCTSNCFRVKERESALHLAIAGYFPIGYTSCVTK